MIGDLYNANNVVVGQAAVFFAPANTPLPAMTNWDVTDPFKAGFWPAPVVAPATPGWQACGATDQGWVFGADKSTQVINIEEQSSPVGTTLTSQNITIAGALSEDITRTLALALNAGVTSVAATSTTPGYDDVRLADAPILYAVGMVTVNASGFGRLIYAPAWTQLNNASVAFRRAADKRQYAVSFATVCKTSDIVIRNFVAPKTGA